MFVIKCRSCAKLCITCISAAEYGVDLHHFRHIYSARICSAHITVEASLGRAAAWHPAGRPGPLDQGALLGPISLPRVSLLRFADSNFPGDSLWAWEFHTLKSRFCLSQPSEIHSLSTETGRRLVCAAFLAAAPRCPPLEALPGVPRRVLGGATCLTPLV